MKHIKIVFMGTPEFAVPSLKKLIEDGHNIVGVVTQPDKKRGRGGNVSFSPIKKVALENNIKVLQPERIRKKSSVDDLRSLGAELFITCAYGQILSQAVLDIPELGCINVHASLLPRYRGAAPIHRAVMNGDKSTGVTTMMTDRGMDTGDILLKAEVEIDDYMTSGTLHDILKATGARVLNETLVKLGEGNLVRIPQDDSRATHAAMLKKEESIIDWSCDVRAIHNKVRALNPWPGCFTTYKAKRMRIISSGFCNEETNVQPGKIVKITKDMIKVACGMGTLEIFELQFENGKAIPVSQCWHNIDADVVLGLKENK